MNTEIERLRGILKEIAKGRGPYKMDPFEHAESCVLTMKSLAERALNDSAFRLDENGEELPQVNQQHNRTKRL